MPEGIERGGGRHKSMPESKERGGGEGAEHA